MAGFGAVVNTAGVTRGDTVAVIGCGGVGNAAIAGAALSAACKVIAVDVDERKLDGPGFGATDVVNARDEDPVEAIQRLTDGADVVIEAVGRPGDVEAGLLRARPGWHRRCWVCPRRT